MRPSVSIIIPTYNRAEFLGETLESVITQSFSNWECIVVDDNSTDYTAELLEFYVEKTSRIKIVNRPKDKSKGANACRNLGLQLSKGEFVIFFDSDDLMSGNHIKSKLHGVRDGNHDYAIAKTKYSNSDIIDEHYNFTSNEISCHNYITQKINWLTYDIIIRADLAKSISFNEKLMAGQEFNYFAKLTNKSNNGVLIDEYLTLRRYHKNSIQGRLRDNYAELQKRIFFTHWFTYLDLKTKLGKNTKRYLINWCIVIQFKSLKENYLFTPQFVGAVVRELGIRKAINYVLAIHSHLFFGRGYRFIKNAHL